MNLNTRHRLLLECSIILVLKEIPLVLKAVTWPYQYRIQKAITIQFMICTNNHNIMSCNIQLRRYFQKYIPNPLIHIMGGHSLSNYNGSAEHYARKQIRVMMLHYTIYKHVKIYFYNTAKMIHIPSILCKRLLTFSKQCPRHSCHFIGTVSHR